MRRVNSVPVPKVTREMVLDKAAQVFPDVPVGEVMAALDRYGVEKWEPERERVQVAVLTLSGGDRAELERFVEIARRDYRDALACAEYPRLMDAGCIGVGTLENDPE